jgi:hypothetical protein
MILAALATVKPGGAGVRWLDRLGFAIDRLR